MKTSRICRRTLDVLVRGKPSKIEDLIGQRFGRLVVVSLVGRGDRHIYYWKCKCDCGDEFISRSKTLLAGNTKSCGCLREENWEKAIVIHGGCRKRNKTPEYYAWANIIARCEQKSTVTYNRYGGRGITMCNRWRLGEGELSGFQCFLNDMGKRPSKNHSMDRIDYNGNYDPINCRWATSKEQARNRSDNVWLVANGEKLLLSEAMKKYGVRTTGFYRGINKYGLLPMDSFVLQSQKPVVVSMI